MTANDVRLRLEEVHTAYRRYLLANEKIAAFKETLLGASTFSDMPHSSKGENSTENKLVRLAMLNGESDAKLAEYLEIRYRADCVINSLADPDEAEVLTRQYLMFQSREEISKKMHFSDEHIRRLHKSALEKIAGGNFDF